MSFRTLSIRAKEDELMDDFSLGGRSCVKRLDI